MKRKSNMKGSGPRTENLANFEPDKHRNIADHSSSTKYDVSSCNHLRFKSWIGGQGEHVAPVEHTLNSYGLMMEAFLHPTLSISWIKLVISAGGKWQMPLMTIDEGGLVGRFVDRNC